MKLLGQILLAGSILAVFRWAVTLIVAVMVFGVMVALIRAPVQTLSVLFGWLILCAFAAHPALGLLLFILVVSGGRLSAK